MTRTAAGVDVVQSVPGSDQPRSGSRSRSTARRRLILVGGVAAALAAGAIVTSRGGSGGISVSKPQIGYVLPSMDPGRTSFFLGGMFLDHPGKEVEIVDIEVLRSPNAEYLGAFTIWPRDFVTNKYDAGQGYPPAQLRDRHPALKTLIPADETSILPTGWSRPTPPPVVVNVGFRLTEGDVAAVNGVRVTYKVNGKKTHQDFRYAVIACVKPNPCSRKDPSGADIEDVVLPRFGLVPRD